MPLKMLRSHYDPDLFLHEHINQVISAMEGIWKWHSVKLISPEIRDYCYKIARFHDTGKGSEAFQLYISNPEQYMGKKIEKSHSPLSLLLTLSTAEKEGWEPLDTLLVAASVYGHHGGFPILINNDVNSKLHQSLDRFSSAEMFKIIKRQLSSIDYSKLEKECGVTIAAPSKNSPLAEKRYLTKNIIPVLLSLPIDEAIGIRLKGQLVFSFLLEADKAFLAVRDSQCYLKREHKIWDTDWIEKLIGNPPITKVNRLRKEIRKSVKEQTVKNIDNPLQSLTAPTGLGKTLLAAEWALKLREITTSEGNPPSKVIVVLPYLSIIEQTAQNYRKLLEFGPELADGSWFLSSHSLSDRQYDPELEEKISSFFIDTWRTELIITTYDQFLMSLMEPKTKYQMRFHNLCDSLIIMDEVQTIPCAMWQLLNGVFKGLASVCNTRMLLMSATLPSFVPDAVPLIANYQKLFNFRRYKFKFNIFELQSLDLFCQNLQDRLLKWLDSEERVLITLNTRKSARKVFDNLKKFLPKNYNDIPIYFISADVTPKDRLDKIAEIKKGQPCIVVSTQCVEAGVDIDMSMIIRDFAPWDSLVQIAGRCNREGLRGEHLPVEIVDLADNSGNRFSEMIYNKVHLAKTREAIGAKKTLGEEETLPMSEEYFRKLNLSTDTGRNHLERFAYWKADIPVRELLRGKQHHEYSFLVVDQDKDIIQDMADANDIADRWERREKWRKLAGRIAKISVTIIAKWGFQPKEIADQKWNHWILKNGYYHPESGIRLETIFVDENNISLVF